VFITCKLNCLLSSCDNIIKIGQIPEVIKVAVIGNTKVWEIYCLVWMPVSCELNGILVILNGILDIGQVTKAIEVSPLGITKN
jgi:hypothetical protein